MNTYYRFQDMLAFSEAVTGEKDLLRHIATCVPNSDGFNRADTKDDLKGTDFWITRRHGLRPLSVDFKHRDFCPIERYGSDDICVEVISQYTGSPNDFPPLREKSKKTGWTLDRKKHTDFIAYTWPHPQGRRFWLVSFPLLCTVAWCHYREWIDQYKLRSTPNETYWTLCVYPPRKIVSHCIEELTDNVVHI